MQNLSYKQTAILLLMMSFSFPVAAQKFRAVTPRVPTAAVTRQVATATRVPFNRAAGVEGFKLDATRPVAGYSRLFGYGNYNPVLGFRIKTLSDNIQRHQPYEMFHPYKGTFALEEGEVVQVAPYVQRAGGEFPRCWFLWNKPPYRS